jgi:hypothetical protein
MITLPCLSDRLKMVRWTSKRVGIGIAFWLLRPISRTASFDGFSLGKRSSAAACGDRPGENGPVDANTSDHMLVLISIDEKRRHSTRDSFCSNRKERTCSSNVNLVASSLALSSGRSIEKIFFPAIEVSSAGEASSGVAAGVIDGVSSVTR